MMKLGRKRNAYYPSIPYGVKVVLLPFCIYCVVSLYYVLFHTMRQENNIVSHSLPIEGNDLPATEKNNITIISSSQDDAIRFYGDITFTNLGWFHPDKNTSLSYARTHTSRNLTDAVQSHHRFNESAWADLEAAHSSSRPIVAFLDVETCFDPNWPSFAMYKLASDTTGGRQHVRQMVAKPICIAISTALQSPALRAPESRLVLLTCGDMSFKIKQCGAAFIANNRKLVVAHLSAHKDDVRSQDIGIAPLPIKSVDLTTVELHDIDHCQNGYRTHLFSFNGRPRIPFPEFSNYFGTIDNQDEDVFVRFNHKHYELSNETIRGGRKGIHALPPNEQASDLYYRLLRKSVFAGSPRGDCLFSYRFSEILSAGTIPVVYADGWVLPFTKDVVDWKDAAVLIPQENVHQTMHIIRSYTPQEVCQMSKKALYIYNTFVKDSHARVRGILRVLDSRLAATNGAYETFSAVPGNQTSNFRRC